MFQISIIILRESLEIFLIFGIIFAATKNLPGRLKFILAGVILGLVGSAILAYSASAISESFDGVGQEIFNIGLLSLTILMICATVIWMRDRSTKIKTDFKNLEQQRRDNFRAQMTLSLMIAALFFREGAEIILFLMSLFAVNNFTLYEILLSSSLGLLGGISAGMIVYLGLFKFAGGKIFQITSYLLILIAAGLASEVANLIDSSDLLHLGSNIFWDSSWLIDDDSIMGRLLKILVGYNSRPSFLQVSFYFLTLSLLVFVTNMKRRG